MARIEEPALALKSMSRPHSRFLWIEASTVLEMRFTLTCPATLQPLLRYAGTAGRDRDDHFFGFGRDFQLPAQLQVRLITRARFMLSMVFWA